MFINRSISIFVFVFFISVVLKGQNIGFSKGYIITHESDTLCGKFAFKNNHYILFKPKGEEKSHFQFYGAYQIKAFKIDDDQSFVSKTVRTNNGERKVFLREVLLGEVSLLYFEELGSNDKYFLIKDGHLSKISNRYFDGYIKSYFSQCDSLDFNNYTYSFNSIKRLVKDYNHCIVPNEPIIEKKKSKRFKLDVGGKFGVNVSYLTIRFPSSSGLSLTSYKTKPGIGYQGGFIFDFKYENISVQTELLYKSYNVSVNESVPEQAKSIVKLGRNSFSHLHIPILLKYKFNHLPFKPGIYVGIPKTLVVGAEFNLSKIMFFDVRVQRIKDENKFGDVILLYDAQFSLGFKF